MRKQFGITKIAVSLSIVASSLTLSAQPALAASSAAAACLSAPAGCVLPIGSDTSVPVAAMADEETGASWVLPALLALAGIGAGLYFLLDDDEDDDEPVSA